MKTKRLIAMLLAMSMLLTLLAGCGKKNDVENGTVDGKEQTDTATTPPTRHRDRSMSLPTPPLTKKKRCI